LASCGTRRSQTGPCSSRRPRLALPTLLGCTDSAQAPTPGPVGQDLIDRLLATSTDLEPCKHDKQGFYGAGPLLGMNARGPPRAVLLIVSSESCVSSA